jgi:hypothetical protein
VPSKNDYLFERRLNDYLFGIIQDNSKGRPSLVFCRWGHESHGCLHVACWLAASIVARF